MSIDGSYEISVKSPMGEQRSTLTIRVDGAPFGGSNAGALGHCEISGTAAANMLARQEKISSPMPPTLDATATIDGDVVSGGVEAEVFGTFPLTGTRTA